MLTNKVHIYRIYFPTSNKSYIGQTNNLDKRMLYHFSVSTLVGRALNKYDDWQILVLHTCKTRDEANRIEIKEIHNYKSINPNGYNLTRGGDGRSGYHLSEETKRKLRAAHLGKKNPKISKIQKGRKRPDVSKRMREGKPSLNAHSVQAEIKRLKTRLVKLEQEI